MSACPSLYIAVAVGPIGLPHVHAAHRQAHAVDGVTSRGHPLVDPVQTFGLFETADPVLRGEASDGCGDRQARNHHTQTQSQTQTHKHTHVRSELIFYETFSRILCIQTPGS